MRRVGFAVISVLAALVLVSTGRAATGGKQLLITPAIHAKPHAGPGRGETTPTIPSKERPGRGNYVFGLASGPPWSTEYAVAGQLAALAAMGQEGGPHGESGPRIAPLVEDTASRNITDLLTNSTTDLAVLPLPSLASAARERPGIKSRLAYIAPLYLQEVHVVARNDVDDIRKLRDRKVVLGARDGVGSLLFHALKIDVDMVDLPADVALAKLVGGEIDAVVLVSGKPLPILSNIGPEKGLHLVPIPYDDSLQQDFLPVQLTRQDYPGLVGSAPSPSLAVQSILAAYVWPRRSERALLLGSVVENVLNRVASTEATVGGADKLKDINWAAALPGWQRLDAAQRWLDAHGAPPDKAGGRRADRSAVVQDIGAPK